MREPIRLFVLFEGIAFIAASLTHFGVVLHGYEHLWAGRAEGVIGFVLLIGFLLSWTLPSRTRGIGIAVQAFALLGTCVGICMIAIGVGPRTTPDVRFHIAIVIALISGLIVAFRAQQQVGI
jgi:hypothetical protein